MKTTISALFDKVRRIRSNYMIDKALQQIEADRQSARPDNDPAATGILIPPSASEMLQAPPVDVPPVFFTNLDLEVRRLPDGTWAVINKTWNVASVKKDPEVALILMWRHIFVNGGVMGMGDVPPADVKPQEIAEQPDSEQ